MWPTGGDTERSSSIETAAIAHMVLHPACQSKQLLCADWISFYADRSSFCSDRRSFMTTEAASLPVEAMDHLEHSSLRINDWFVSVLFYVSQLVSQCLITKSLIITNSDSFVYTCGTNTNNSESRTCTHDKDYILLIFTCNKLLLTLAGLQEHAERSRIIPAAKSINIVEPDSSIFICVINELPKCV